MAPLPPAAAHHRARLAGLRKRPPGDPEVLDAQRGLASAKIADYIERTLAAAPPLTAEQRDKLAELLRPVRAAEGA
jgi:hypothetical protein